ncbi:MAG: DUF1802 family protein [Tepidisphaeraceae bacterium]|jgi:hypothetical protein
MALPPQLQIALKEWQTVCDALADARQILLLRKGGIYESAGEFQIEHRQFLLFPTHVHQNPDMLKPGIKVQKLAAEPERLSIRAAAEITDIILMSNRAAMDALDDQHIWTAPLIDMRFNYRPENPLYLLLVRAYTLPAPIQIDNTPAYAGCKSWVPLETPHKIQNPKPSLDDEQFATRRNAILAHLP